MLPDCCARAKKIKRSFRRDFPSICLHEVLVGDEIRLENMIKNRGLEAKELLSGKRMVAGGALSSVVGAK